MLGMTLSCDIDLKQELKLSFGNFIITPNGTCPKCKYAMNDKEILKGFSDDVYDVHTTCCKCGHRFLSNLVITPSDRRSKKEPEIVTWYCPAQTLQALRDMDDVENVEDIAENHRHIFYNCVKNFGSYEKALEKLENDI